MGKPDMEKASESTLAIGQAAVRPGHSNAGYSAEEVAADAARVQEIERKAAADIEKGNPGATKRGL
jgi:hypothetical protein